MAKLNVQAELSKLAKASIKAQLQPLEPQLPFDVDIKQLNAQWPLIGESDYVVDASHLSVKGSLQGYQLDIDANLKGKNIPDVNLETQGEGNLSEVALSKGWC